jgi:4-hydroxybenzoate polyprenyltransferase/phosphoserine phosphatase
MRMTYIPTNPKPLCIDLDGTLIRTDCLFETLVGTARKNPATLLQAPVWFAQGRPKLKEELANRFTPDLENLPWNQEVLAFAKEEKAKGRKVLLVTASHRIIAEKIAEHAGIFDEVLATSTGGPNLKSKNKAALLLSRFGEKGFDYIGNEDCDLPVWEAGGAAFIANSTPALERKAGNLGIPVKPIGERKTSLAKAASQACRPHQWAKNSLLFVPLMTAHLYTDSALIFKTVLAFLAMGLCASSVYLTNDLMDLESDRTNQSKRKRPIPEGKLPIHIAIMLVPILVVTSFCTGWFLINPTFTFLLLVYLLITSAYSFHIKHKILLDVFLLAGLYSMRIFIGASTSCPQQGPLFEGYVQPSNWLITFSSLFFFSLAMAKRYAELYNLLAQEKERPSGRNYHVNDMPLLMQFGVTSGFLAVLVMALYVQSGKSTSLYNHPSALWLVCPPLLLWISYIWLVTSRGKMREDPVTFAIRDKLSYLVGLIMLLAPWLADPK